MPLDQGHPAQVAFECELNRERPSRLHDRVPDVQLDTMIYTANQRCFRGVCAGLRPRACDRARQSCPRLTSSTRSSGSLTQGYPRSQLYGHLYLQFTRKASVSPSASSLEQAEPMDKMEGSAETSSALQFDELVHLTALSFGGYIDTVPVRFLPY